MTHLRANNPELRVSTFTPSLFAGLTSYLMARRASVKQAYQRRGPLNAVAGDATLLLGHFVACHVAHDTRMPIPIVPAQFCAT